MECTENKVDNNEKRETKFEDALELTGYGLFNISIFLTSGGSLMCVIIETMAMMFIVPAAQCDLELTLTTKGLLSAISFLGVVSFSYFWGFIADTRGRRRILIISMLGSFTTSLLSSLSPNAWTLIALRYVNGVLVGGSSAVSFAYCSEFHSRLHRPRTISLISIWVAVGMTVLPGLAWLILPMQWSYTVPILSINYLPWRLLLALNSAPSLLIGLIILLGLPETPKYLLAAGENEKALEVLRRMFVRNTGKKASEYPVDSLVWDEVGLNLKNQEKVGLLRSLWRQTVPLFKAPYGLKTFLVSLLHFGIFAPSSGLAMWYPEIINKLAHYEKNHPFEEPTLCGAIEYFTITSFVNITEVPVCIDTVHEDVFITPLILGCTCAIMYLIISSLINKLGPKNLLVIFLSATAACGFASQFISGTQSIQAFIGIFLTASTCIGIVNIIVVDLYPTQLRAMALAISLMAGRIGAVTASNITGPLLASYCDYTLLIYGADHLILIVAVLLLPSSQKKKLIEPVV